MTDIINGPIVEGCFVRLRDGGECGPMRREGEPSFPWTFAGSCWDDSGSFMGRNSGLIDGWDIIEVLPARSAAPVEPSYEQKLWDEVAKEALNGCLSYSHMNEAWGDYHNNGSRASVCEHAMNFADAFMAERAKRMKP